MVQCSVDVLSSVELSERVVKTCAHYRGTSRASTSCGEDEGAALGFPTTRESFGPQAYG